MQSVGPMTGHTLSLVALIERHASGIRPLVALFLSIGATLMWSGMSSGLLLESVSPREARMGQHRCGRLLTNSRLPLVHANRMLHSLSAVIRRPNATEAATKRKVAGYTGLI